MTPYELGFRLGEWRAFKDRQRGLFRLPQHDYTTEGQRGYRDGYTPRSQHWWQKPEKA